MNFKKYIKKIVDKTTIMMYNIIKVKEQAIKTNYSLYKSVEHNSIFLLNYVECFYRLSSNVLLKLNKLKG